MPRTPTFLTLLWLSCLALLDAPAALAHGERNEAELAEFHRHLDDYRGDVEALAGEIDAIVAAHAAGESVKPRIDALIERWEDVGVHAAIESHAAPTYPGIWQGLARLQQAAASGDAVSAAGEAAKAALWQGLGALRLAASQVEAGTPDTAAAPLSGPAAIGQIQDDLERAVAAYADEDTARAERLIHDAYMSRFEGLEGDLIERDPELVAALERDFNASLPMLMQQGAPLDRVRAKLEDMKEKLDSARAILETVD